MKKATLFTLSALVLFACAAPVGSGDGDSGDGDGDGDGTPNTGGTTQTGTGGTIQPGGTGGTVQTGTGGTVQTGTGGTTGGSVIECMGTAWAVANGYVDNGTWCGYGYTAAWNGAMVMPTSFEGATELCANGSTNGPEADPSFPGFEVGFGVKDHMTEAANKGSWVISGSGVTITFTATGATGDSAVVAKLGIPGTTDSSYAVRLTSAQASSGSVTLPWSSFNTAPWDNSGMAPTPGTTPISQIALQVRGTDVAQTVSSLCINSVTLNP